MKKYILGLLCLLTGGIAIFIYQHLTVYKTPEVLFQDAQKAEFQKLDFSPAWQCFQNDEVTPTPNREFRLLSWNIHKGEDPNWQQDLQAFAKQKDFVLLQEATSTQQIPQQQPAFNTFLHLFAFQYRDQKSGILNLSTLDADRYCLNSSLEPLLRLPKLMSAMRFPFENGKSLLLINVHLINFDLTNHSYQKQLDSLKNLVQQHQGAVILAGDFNTWNETRKIKLAELTQALMLTEIPLKPDNRIRVFGHSLDYLFARNIIVHSATSHRVKSSDHNPLELHFSLE
ncbi:TPA: endonuclease/exonuclease/phosphatase family protein [Mannheimia haemolytica]